MSTDIKYWRGIVKIRIGIVERPHLVKVVHAGEVVANHKSDTVKRLAPINKPDGSYLTLEIAFTTASRIETTNQRLNAFLMIARGYLVEHYPDETKYFNEYIQYIR